jgi:hypothetical protein
MLERLNLVNDVYRSEAGGPRAESSRIVARHHAESAGATTKRVSLNSESSNCAVLQPANIASGSDEEYGHALVAE